jgi:hypothetical protein
VTAFSVELPVLQEALQFCGRIDQRPCDGCDGCGTRCTAGVEMLESEFRAICAELGHLAQAERDRVLGQSKNVKVPGTEYSYTACRFRDVDGARCLIYRARPLICRLFGHVEWLPCPIEKVRGPVAGGIELMRAYAEQTLKTYEEWVVFENAQGSAAP